MRLNHNKISCIKLVHLLYLYIWCTVTLISNSNDCFFDPLSTTGERILRKRVSYSNLPSTFVDMNSRTNQLSQKSHQWSDDDLHWLRCELYQDLHHFDKLNVGQILAGPHMTFTPFKTWIPLVHLSPTWNFFLKSFLQHGNSFSSWFP